MDVLSEVLKAVKLEGALFFNAEFSAPWSLSSSPSTVMAPLLCPGAGHLFLYHFLIEGRAHLRLADGTREDLKAGDIVMLPHGDAHVLGNGTPRKAVDAVQTFGKTLTDELKIVRFGGGGEVTRFVCGFMACDPRLREIFLDSLPRVLKVHVADEPAGQWLKNSIQFSVGEVNASSAGSGLVLAKLAEVLFVETLRRYINNLAPGQIGWLAGARDPVVGRALALLHKQPAEAWTIAALARRVGVSRTRLTDRFRHFLDESPMSYLARWRLKLGAEILQSTKDSVAEIALAVGYGSESSFNRAFRREFDCPPAQFRRRSHRVP